MGRKTCILHGRIFTPLEVIEEGILEFEDGLITKVAPKGEKPSRGAKVIEASGKLVSPGFIDTHIHGANGVDVEDCKPTDVAVMAAFLVRHGVTGFFPTTPTTYLPRILKALNNIRNAMRKGVKGATPLGAHIEGPYFAKPQPGCHLAAVIRDPDPKEYEQIMAYEDVIKRITLAPELPGALELIRRCAAKRIVISGGHSDATYDEVMRAVAAGMTHITHCYSAMSLVKRVNAYRVPGMLEATLESDELTTEIIADGHHLPAPLIRLILKCKGVDKVILVSDSMRAAGLPEGIYQVCGQDCIVEGGVARTMDRQSFASSITMLDAMVQHLVFDVGCGLRDALTMATLNPARIFHLDSRKGRLALGKDADIVLLNERLEVEKTFVAGRLCFSCSDGAK